MKLVHSFFEDKKTLDIAKELIGKVLVYESPKGIIKGIINETESYTEDDESCHAYNGKKTKKNEVMFKRFGHLYVYFTYGMYHCINIVTAEENKGEAVLIRSVIPLDEKSKELMIKNRFKDSSVSLKPSSSVALCNGPAKLTLAYGFDKSFNGVDLLDKNSKIYLEDLKIKSKQIQQTTRIGISKAKDLPWRFIGEFD